MSTINSGLSALFEVLQLPFRTLPSIVGVLFWSVLTAVAVLLVYKRASDQEGLGDVKRRIHAGLFEIRLFNDDMRAIFRAQLEILRHNLTYLKLSLKPMIYILPPMVILIAQLHFYYGYRSLRPGEQALLTVELAEGWKEHPALAGATVGRPPIALQVPEGLRSLTDGVWAPALNEVVWQIGAENLGDYQLGVQLGTETVTKRVRVSDRVVQVAPVRPEPSLLAQLESPAETPIPATSPIRQISLDYPDGEIWCLWSFRSEWAWMLVYFVLTMVIAFALRNPLGVNI